MVDLGELRQWFDADDSHGAKMVRDICNELAALRRVRDSLPINAAQVFRLTLNCSPVRLCAGGKAELITDDEIRDALRAALESEAGK